MNIFVLDKDPRLCAQYHDDVRVNKMCVEYTQLLSTVSGVGYKPVRMNPDCVWWVRESVINQGWLICLAYELFGVFMDRRKGLTQHCSYDTFSMIVSSDETYRHILDHYIRYQIYPLPQSWNYSVPDDCIVEGDIVESYRLCFNRYKKYDKNGNYIAKWTYHPTPRWFIP